MKASISTKISLPGTAEHTYETTATIPPGEAATKEGIISLLVGHLALLTDQLDAIRGTKSIDPSHIRP